MEISSEAAFTFCARQRILTLEFSPFEWCKSLIAVGHQTSVAVYSVTFKEESEDNAFSCKHIWECQVPGEPCCLAWHPSSTLRSVPRCLQILLGTSSNSVLELNTDLKEEHTLQQIASHNDCVNSIAYSPDGNVVYGASTGDDLVVKIWDCSDNEIITKFLLTSPGMSVKFHSNDADFLMVAERCGIIRIYSIRNSCATVSVRCTPAPILSADWSLLNPSLILAVGPSGANVIKLGEVKDFKKSLKISGTKGAVVAALNRCGGQVAAVISNPNTFRLISLSTMKVPLAVNLKTITGLSWHCQLGYVAVASDTKVHLWKNDCA